MCDIRLRCLFKKSLSLGCWRLTAASGVTRLKKIIGMNLATLTIIVPLNPFTQSSNYSYCLQSWQHVLHFSSVQIPLQPYLDVQQTDHWVVKKRLQVLKKAFYLNTKVELVILEFFYVGLPQCTAAKHLASKIWKENDLLWSFCKTFGLIS